MESRQIYLTAFDLINQVYDKCQARTVHSSPPTVPWAWTTVAPAFQPSDGNYNAAASADDLKGVLGFLNITFTYVFAHEEGVGMTVALAAQYPAS
ncbi:hypothetical protein F4774DRAFT_410219 [Daldinia eschscholtzii]|nr:hypothetical protein F4774DRAFT_410219 [Daldinia eschscholtzii]